MILKLADTFKGVSCPGDVVRFLKPYITSILIIFLNKSTTFQKNPPVDFL